MLRRGAAIGLLLATITLAGCGDDDTSGRVGSGLPDAGGGGSLAYAIPDLPATTDPLAAADRASQTVMRQIYEPLVERLVPPYGSEDAQPGLALNVEPSKDRTTWTVTLRTGVRFQDGTAFNAAAVLANARRWQGNAQARRLIPNLFAVDASRPAEVRFLLDKPVRDLPLRLASPRLGIVSPQAFEPQSGEGARFLGGTSGSGTGAFEPGTSGSDRLELSRYAGWWGSAAGLGPSLDGLVFVAAPGDAQRLRLLQGGSVQVADPLGPASLRAVAANPLLTTAGGPESGIGMEGSVRGITSAKAIPLLAGVWLTRLNR